MAGLYAACEAPSQGEHDAPHGVQFAGYCHLMAQSPEFGPGESTGDRVPDFLGWVSPPEVPSKGGSPPCESRGGGASRRRRQNRARRMRASIMPNSPDGSEELPDTQGTFCPSGRPVGGVDLAKVDPATLKKCKASCEEIHYRLELGDREERAGILSWLIPATLELSLSDCGCVVVQKALEVAGARERDALVGQLRSHVKELVVSPHGNHVLQRSIEVLPPQRVDFVLDELASYQGGWVALARHRYACRVELRLLEYCPEHMTRHLVAAVVRHAVLLSYNAFGNYVVQHVLEYATVGYRDGIAFVLAEGDMKDIVTHRIASIVLQRALAQSSPEGQRRLGHKLISLQPNLLEIAKTRPGSATVKQLIQSLTGPIREEALRQLLAGIEELNDSKHGKALAAFLTYFKDDV